jgi:hypothetical protein
MPSRFPELRLSMQEALLLLFVIRASSLFEEISPQSWYRVAAYSVVAVLRSVVVTAPAFDFVEKLQRLRAESRVSRFCSAVLARSSLINGRQLGSLSKSATLLRRAPVSSVVKGRSEFCGILFNFYFGALPVV